MFAFNSPRKGLRACLAAGVFAAMSVLTPAPAQAAVELLVVDGILTGARNVDVGGTLYDVSFLDGSCAGLFSGCDAASDFPFDLAGAQVASQALLDQVFIDSPAGQFDSRPALTFGCVVDNFCFAITPTLPASGISGFFDRASANNSRSVVDQVLALANDAVTTDFRIRATEVFAVWTPVTAVPEPNAYALGGIGLAVLVAMHRRRQRKAVGQ